jgi:predicted DNA-binding transcriptional regulator AlpA
VRADSPLGVLGLAEIADLLGVSRQTVDQWRTRGRLPEPDGTVGGRPAWRTETITAWAAQTGRAGS